MQSYLIFMAVRLIEIRRILKPTGSIYLHCDPAASHYLKVLMDGVLGQENCRGEIVWKRTSAHSGARRPGPVHDVILFYSAGSKYKWTRLFQQYDDSYIRQRFKGRDRKWKDADLTGSGVRYGETGKTWRGFDVTAKGRHWAYTPDQLDRMDAEGRIYWPAKKGGWPRERRFLDELKGIPLQDVWTDIPPINSQARERTGYPTQKPLALLDRIIRASSDEGDMVLDPFCGCATTLVAADRLRRKWAGIDLSALAVKLVDNRIAEDRGLWGGATALTEPPKRTDLGTLPNYRTHRHRLYGEQEGVCVGCETHFPFRVMDVDHILPRSRGGTDHPDNLQLLCSGCNRSKGGRTMAEWRASQ